MTPVAIWNAQLHPDASDPESEAFPRGWRRFSIEHIERQLAEKPVRFAFRRHEVLVSTAQQFVEEMVHFYRESRIGFFLEW